MPAPEKQFVTHIGIGVTEVSHVKEHAGHRNGFKKKKKAIWAHLRLFWAEFLGFTFLPRDLLSSRWPQPLVRQGPDNITVARSSVPRAYEYHVYCRVK